MSSASLPSSYVCDTLPAARLATTSDDYPSDPPFVDLSEVPVSFEAPTVLDNITSSSEGPDNGSPPPSQQPPPRKLCVRHQRMADEGTNLKLQQVGCPACLVSCTQLLTLLTVSRCLTP
jgi:F-box/WD-40 domain protein MET30